MAEGVVDHASGASPLSARRQLDQRRAVSQRVGEGLSRQAGEVLLQFQPETFQRQRTGIQYRGAGGHQLFDGKVGDGLGAGDGAPGPLEQRGRQAAQQDGIGRRDGVDGASHDQQSDQAAVPDRVGQRRRGEALHPGEQRQIRAAASPGPAVRPGGRPRPADPPRPGRSGAGAAAACGSGCAASIPGHRRGSSPAQASRATRRHDWADVDAANGRTSVGRRRTGTPDRRQDGHSGPPSGRAHRTAVRTGRPDLHPGRRRRSSRGVRRAPAGRSPRTR